MDNLSISHERCNKQKGNKIMSKIRNKCYLHASKESMWDLGEKLGLQGEALGMFKHGFCEVEVEFEADTETGEVEMIAVKWGKQVARPLPPAEPANGMHCIPAAQIDFDDHTLWVQSPIGATILRIRCPDGISMHKCQSNPVSHADLVVKGPVALCVSDDLDKTSEEFLKNA